MRKAVGQVVNLRSIGNRPLPGTGRLTIGRRLATCPTWLVFLLVQALYAQALPSRSEIDHAMQELSAITGFPIRHRVEFESITRDQVNKFLRERIKEAIKPEELRAEELTLKKFGFIPQDFDLKAATIDLLTEQAAAFYDFHRKKLFIADWASSGMRDVALVHELAHALADQSFSLEKFTRKVENDSEKSMARQAVVEGQASWLMTEVLARRSGKSLADKQMAKQILQAAAESSSGEYPVFDTAPLYLRETLLFPYTEGMFFQQAIFDQHGQRAFAEVFGRPPVSTQQVVHPAKYFADTHPSSPKLPRAPHDARGLIEGQMGEIEHSILLQQYIGKAIATEMSPLWKGAMYRLFESKKDKRVMLAYASEWSDAAAARRYFEFYRQVLGHKWKSMEVLGEDESQVNGRGDDGYFQLNLDGAVVTSREGSAGPWPAR